jgi:hypothetical protein
VDSFLRAGVAKDLRAFPLPEDFVPTENGVSATKDHDQGR